MCNCKHVCVCVKIDWTKPIQTRDRRPARVIKLNSRSQRPYLVLVTDACGDEIVWSYVDEFGVAYVWDNDRKFNVENVPTTRKVFTLVFRGTDGKLTSISALDAPPICFTDHVKVALLQHEITP